MNTIKAICLIIECAALVLLLIVIIGGLTATVMQSSGLVPGLVFLGIMIFTTLGQATGAREEGFRDAQKERNKR